MSRIDRYTKFISEQIRKEDIVGLRTNIREADATSKKPLSAKTAGKHERAALEKHFGSTFESGQHGRGPQYQYIMNTGMSGDQMHKKLTAAGYKLHYSGPNNKFGGRTKKVSSVTGRMTDTGDYQKTDQHGHKHNVSMYHDSRQSTIQHSV